MKEVVRLNDKIKIFLSFFIVSGCVAPRTGAQALKITERLSLYHKEVQKDSLQLMVELRSTVPYLRYDLRYATADNFTGKILYPSDSISFMRKLPAAALVSVARQLKEKNIGLLIFDAYRPYSVTKKMWDLIGDERYVANPAKGSGHNRGISVDLTLVDLATGKTLDMGTPFDNFTDTAHHSFSSLPERVLANRRLLKKTMEDHGFRALDTEWWHYSWPNDRNYAVLNLRFRQLLRKAY